jgi:hypothetical protein
VARAFLFDLPDTLPGDEAARVSRIGIEIFGLWFWELRLHRGQDTSAGRLVCQTLVLADGGRLGDCALEVGNA